MFFKYHISFNSFSRCVMPFTSYSLAAKAYTMINIVLNHTNSSRKTYPTLKKSQSESNNSWRLRGMIVAWHYSESSVV